MPVAPETSRRGLVDAYALDGGEEEVVDNELTLVLLSNLFPSGIKLNYQNEHVKSLLSMISPTIRQDYL